MKRIVSGIIVLAVLICAVSGPAAAAEQNDNIEYLDDGSYIVTTIVESGSRASGTNSGSKTRHYYNSDDVLQWIITVTGTFSYDGTSATCTYVTGTTSIANTTNWHAASKVPSRSGNTATYTVTFDYKVLGITTSRPSYSVSLSCDANGNLS